MKCGKSLISSVYSKWVLEMSWKMSVRNQIMHCRQWVGFHSNNLIFKSNETPSQTVHPTLLCLCKFSWTGVEPCGSSTNVLENESLLEALVWNRSLARKEFYWILMQSCMVSTSWFFSIQKELKRINKKEIKWLELFWIHWFWTGGLLKLEEGIEKRKKKLNSLLLFWAFTEEWKKVIRG